MDVLAQIFPGIATLFMTDPVLGAVRVGLTILGFVLAYFGFKGKLEPLIMVPMGLGMIAVNCGVLFLDGGTTGTLIIDPLVSETDDLMTAIQVNFLQPIYNFMFSNNLIACLVFMGIGARSEISFLLARDRKPEYAVMRMLGESRLQITLKALLEQFVLCLAGVSLGAAAGHFMEVVRFDGVVCTMILLCYTLGAAVAVMLTVRAGVMDILRDKE